MKEGRRSKAIEPWEDLNVRFLSSAFTALLSLFILPGVGWAAPNIIIKNVTANCPGPTITITIDNVSAGFFLISPNAGLYVFFDGLPTGGMHWAPSSTPNNPATFTPSPALLPGPHTLNVSYSNTPLPGGDYAFTAPNCAGAQKGMTWIQGASNNQTGTITVGCGSTGPNPCDAYNGDTVCTTALPLLCIYKPTPPFPVPPGVTSSVPYNEWSGGVVATTAPVPGPSTLTAANSLCAAFGPGWRVAEFHDGWGWNFQAYGGVGQPSKRFWVHINDQPATCWH
jgi:hypothetical protein